MYHVNYRLSEGGALFTFTVRAENAEKALDMASDLLHEMYGRPVGVWL